MLLSVMLGLGGGLGVAYLLDNLDDIIDSIEEAERMLGYKIVHAPEPAAPRVSL